MPGAQLVRNVNDSGLLDLRDRAERRREAAQPTDNALYLRQWAADIRANNGKSVDADRLDSIADEIERLRLQSSPGYPWLPCPICKGTEGCDHAVPERARAALTPER